MQSKTNHCVYIYMMSCWCMILVMFIHFYTSHAKSNQVHSFTLIILCIKV